MTEEPQGNAAVAGQVDQGVRRLEPAREGLRGLGVTITHGGARNWYQGADGVRRWLNNDQPCNATRGCAECAWGKVAGCWRCGSR